MNERKKIQNQQQKKNYGMRKTMFKAFRMRRSTQLYEKESGFICKYMYI